MLTGFTSFTKSKICKSTSDYNQRKCNLSLLDIWGQVDHISSDNSSDLEAIYQATITPTKFAVNVNTSLVRKVATIQTTMKFDDTADNTLSCNLALSLKGNINLDFNRLFKIQQYV